MARGANTFWDDRGRLRIKAENQANERERERLERQLNEMLEWARTGGRERGEAGARGKRPSATKTGGTGGRRGFASSAVLRERVDKKEKLPTSEKELFALLARLRRLHQPPTAAFISSFHSHPLLRPFVSPRSYALVVHHCYEKRDLRAARQVLDEMAERGVSRTDALVRTLLRAALTRGDAATVQELVASEGERGRQLLPLLNWRRDLGEEGKGRGDAWKVRTKSEARKLQEEWERKVGARATGVAGTQDSVEVHPDLDGRLQRQRTLIPQRVRGLSNYDITVLVESLVQDCRAPEAFHVAQAWLSSNRPKPFGIPPPPPPPSPPPDPSPPYVIYRPAPVFILPRLRPPSPFTPSLSTDSTFLRACATYEKTLLVLLNILLRALIIDGALEQPCQAFVTDFLSSNSPHSYPVTPNATTLLELVQSVRVKAPQWKRACGIVEWMGRTEGLPKETTRARRRFGEADDEARMIECVPPRVALLMLRLALDEEEHRTQPDSKKRFAARVAGWWSRIDRRSDLWETAEAREVMNRAVKVGLVERWKRVVESEEKTPAVEVAAGDEQAGGAKQKTATA